jgi:hypothetical protein
MTAGGFLAVQAGLFKKFLEIQKLVLLVPMEKYPSISIFRLLICHALSIGG